MPKRILSGLVLAWLLLAATASAGQAGAWIRWGSGPQIDLVRVEIPLSERESSLERYVYQIGPNWYSFPDFEFPLNCDYPQHLNATGGGDSFLDVTGDPIYVRIGQGVGNTGTESWADYHIRTRDGGYPYKIYGSWWPAWNLYSSPDGEGWDCVMDPGGIKVGPGATLYNEFWIRVDPLTNQFTVETWPTVPEPGALLTLGAGLAALGAGIRLRRNSK